MMKINKQIESYNATVAFGMLLAEDETCKYTEFIDITEIVGDKSIEPYRGLGLLFCKRTCNLGTNENKVQFKIDETIEPGVRNWLTSYVLIPDFKTNNKAIIIDDILYYSLKSEAEKKAKIWCAENARDIHIKMVKRLESHSPINTSILYKPSLNQKMSEFFFFD